MVKRHLSNDYRGAVKLESVLALFPPILVGDLGV